jgi:hypothetical protein
VHRVTIPNGDLNYNLNDDQIYEDANDEEEPIISEDKDGENPLHSSTHILEGEIDGATMNNYLSESLVAQEHINSNRKQQRYTGIKIVSRKANKTMQSNSRLLKKSQAMTRPTTASGPEDRVSSQLIKRMRPKSSTLTSSRRSN